MLSMAAVKGEGPQRCGPQELKAGDTLNLLPIDMGRGLRAFLVPSEIQDDLLGLFCVEGHVVVVHTTLPGAGPLPCKPSHRRW